MQAQKPRSTTRTPARRQAVPQPEPQPETTQPTTARQWKQTAQDGELYVLPGSGHIARLRRPSLTALAAEAGEIPNPLSIEVMRFLAHADEIGGLTRPTEAQLIVAYEKNARAFVEIAALAFVEPKLILDRDPDYDAGEIAPSDVADLDYVWITGRLVEGQAADLASFRVN